MEVAKMYEPVIVKSFWRKHTEEELNAMSDEEVMQLVDSHVETFMDAWQKRNKGKDFVALYKITTSIVGQSKPVVNIP